MDSLCGSDILKLAEILKPPYEEDEPFDDKQKVRTSTKKTVPPETQKPTIVKNQDTEEDFEARLEKEINGELSESDWRKTPQWNLIYKQAVTPSDVYLQLGGKTPMTSSCEDMVITINLPGEKLAGIDVKVTKEQLDVLSSNFRLSVPLSHPVDPQRGNAKWDSTTEQLILTLVMNRELDYVNF